MSLKKQVWQEFVVIFLVAIILFSFVFYFTASSIEDSLEKRFMRNNLERVISILENDLRVIDKMVNDEAEWDDTYWFVLRKNQDYVEKNYRDSTFENARINYVAFLDAQGDLVYAKGYDFKKKQRIEVPADIFIRVNTDKGKKGLLKTDKGLVLVAARPVSKSDRSEMGTGTIIYGRLLDAEEKKTIEERAGVKVNIYPSSEKPFFISIGGNFDNGKPFYLKNISNEEATVFTSLNDICGKESFYLEISYKRWLPDILMTVAHILAFLLIVVLAVCFYLIYKWIDEKLLRRVIALTEAVEKVDRDYRLKQDIPVFDEDDEIATLSLSVKEMLNRINEQQDAVIKNEQKWHSLLSNAPGAIFVIQGGKILFARGRLLEEAGYNREEIVGKPFKNFVYWEDFKRLLSVYEDLLGGTRKKLIYAFRIIDKKDNIIWIEDNAAVIKWEGLPATLHFVRDITARKILEEEINRLMEEKNMILDSLAERVALVDCDMHIIWTNKKFVGEFERGELQNVGELWGAKCYELWGKRNDICPGCPVPEAIKTGRMAAGEVELPDGRIWRINANPVRDKKGSITGVVKAGLDVTERKRYEEQLRYLSLHDGLTGLHNRAYFETEMKRLEKSRDYPITIVIADLDGLKLVNDTMGHNIGDEMLKAFADVLRSVFGSSDQVFRIGGDEFAVLLPGTDKEDADNIMKRMYAAFDAYNEKHPALPIKASLGVATALSPDEPLVQVFKRADDFMYRNKMLNRAGLRHNILNALMATLAEKDYLTCGHAERLKDICLKMGENLKLSYQQMNDLALLAEIHDIGKVSVPDSILFKSAPLTEKEWDIIRQHAEKGYRIALSSPDLAAIADLILKHHERWDGTGYPLGLKGEEIPLECRILAIADAFDAMTGERPYRKPMTCKEALEEIKRNAGSQFDPYLVEVFLSIMEDK